MPETLLLVFDGTTTYSFSRADKQAASVFGGPMEYKISGKRPVPDRLHHIARLNHNDLPFLGYPRHIWDLPLLYGLRYSDGNLTYQFENTDINVLVSPGMLTEDWPYRHYPDLLPYIPMAITNTKKQTWREFATEFPNMKKEQPAEFVVICPCPMTTGVSLWGREGDAEGVAMIFECDLEGKKVSTYNVCS
jgi:hypothetical protein